MLQLLGLIIDCPDPMRLAAFYSEVTGRDLMEGSSDSSAGIPFGEVGLTFQRVEDYRPPRWPDDEHPKQYHLDFEVDLIEPEQRRVVELGATLRRTSSDPRDTAGRSTPTRSGIPSASAATKGSRGPTNGWRGPDPDCGARWLPAQGMSIDHPPVERRTTATRWAVSRCAPVWGGRNDG